MKLEPIDQMPPLQHAERDARGLSGRNTSIGPGHHGFQYMDNFWRLHFVHSLDERALPWNAVAQENPSHLHPFDSWHATRLNTKGPRLDRWMSARHPLLASTYSSNPMHMMRWNKR